ncbi:MAG TPA: glycoside hydrolase family 30 beta sandwich domain-containing protein [Gemmatimonadaceae bacterium]|nr:glycoside hydrolase family 30 beta sandwich domain-containing protein [Gemmatimonadaceae bacterium]
MTAASAAASLVLAACVTTPPASPAATLAGAPVEVWLTTGDRTSLLARQTDVRFGAANAAAPVQSDADATIKVDTTASYQEMVGFGAAVTDAAAWLIQTRLTPSQRDSLMRDLFGRGNGIGLSFVRLTIGASDFSLAHYSLADPPADATEPSLEHFSIEPTRGTVLPTVRQALAINPRLRVMASPWSAPAWMKTSGSLIGGTLRDDSYDAFADYLRRYIEAYAAEGVPIWAITLQNEPHHVPDDYPGMRLDPAQRTRLIARHVGPAFEQRGLRTLIFDWDHNWDEPESPLGVLADTAARRWVAGVAWHCYGGDVSAQSLVRERHPDVDTYFTECSGGEWAPSFGDNLVWNLSTLIIGATRHWARGVLLWNLALDEAHGPHLGGCSDCRGVVTIDSRNGAVTRNEEYYALAHASRFVLPGARRIESTAGASGVESVAFRNPDDGSFVLIAVNTAAAPRRVSVRVGRAEFRYSIDARAAVTFRWHLMRASTPDAR